MCVFFGSRVLIFKAQLKQNSVRRPRKSVVFRKMHYSFAMLYAHYVVGLVLFLQAEYPKLSAVLFGEGVLNDAMSILLFHTVSSNATSLLKVLVFRCFSTRVLTSDERASDF